MNTNFENNEVIQKIFKMMETMTQRILEIENNKSVNTEY